MSLAGKPPPITGKPPPLTGKPPPFAGKPPPPSPELRRKLELAASNPNNFTLPAALKACAGAGASPELRQLHGLALKAALAPHIFVANTLISAYSSMGLFFDAHQVFDEMPHRDVVSWNALISALSKKGTMGTARQLFDEMPERNLESWNFVVSGYVRVGAVEEARAVFEMMPVRDVVSWNVMIKGLVGVGRFEDAILAFREMQMGGVRPDECSVVNVLCACARSGAVGQGEWVAAYVGRSGFEVRGFLATALVDMYSKCGSVEKALQVFERAEEKDVSTWNAMIDGLSSHGLERKAMEVFEVMLREGVVPNKVTFVAVLSACSHAGFLDEGRELFDRMVSVYGIDPEIEHYGCMVDLLGRAGLLKEAEELVRSVSFRETSVLWESLLGACRSHGDFGLAKEIAKQLIEQSPQNTAYVQLSNMCASFGRWNDTGNLRGKMREQGLKKEPGCSMIEVDGVVHEFFSG